MHVRVEKGKRKRIPEGFAAAENGKRQYKPDGNHQHKPQQGTEQKCNGCNFFPEKNAMPYIVEKPYLNCSRLGFYLSILYQTSENLRCYLYVV